MQILIGEVVDSLCIQLFAEEELKKGKSFKIKKKKIQRVNTIFLKHLSVLLPPG